MIRRVLSIVFYVVAGFFLYMVSLLAFIDGTALDTNGALGANGAAAAKWLPIVIFAVPAVLTLVVGLAIMGFRQWRRDTGIVFLSAAGFTTFLVFSVVSMFMNEEYRKMMPPDIDVLKFFGDYITGASVLVVLMLAGVLLVVTGRKPRTVAAERQG